MNARADATLAAIVANVAASGTNWQFWPADVGLAGDRNGRCLSAGTVERHMRDAGYAVSAGGGWWELTPAGLAAVETARAARLAVPGAGAASGAGVGTGDAGTRRHGAENGGVR